MINKARRLIGYTALHAAVCGRLWLQLRLYVRRRIFARVELCACRRLRTKKIIQVCIRQRVRVVKEVDSKSTGLCPREFKSRRCRFFTKILTPEGIEPPIFGSGIRRVTIAPWSQFISSYSIFSKNAFCGVRTRAD